ncbi:DHA2 family efflux MFS transporter permease subunit [Anaeroselena agilis]|uniref:DHA2 family efflux MFS transporter permease subunit n=1 Tax=Anaeroselena agilis TaxID=3063788 RepID=A0ABU3P176_9FIRM|nr:DHA2 family efflux MFS transporter permease subunit [Selenomonadales bacterium 4137-cl]
MFKKYAILCTVCLGTVLSAYVSSCVNIALPNIMAALNYNMDSIVWVSLGYMLPYGSSLPVTGRLGDQYGAKTLYVAGLVIFTAASMLCGLATSSAAMIVFRIAQGIGGGMLLPNAMTIVAQTFDAHERGQALGVWSAMAAGGSAMGPIIGGYLIERFDWRAIFFSVGPVCAVSIALAVAVIPASRRNPAASIDYLGAALLIASISSLLVALNQGQREGWDSLFILSLLYIAFAAFVMFIAVEQWVEQPMVEIQLFRDLNFAVANVVGFVSFVAFYGGMFLLPFFLKSVLDYSSTTAGMAMLPLTASMVVSSPVGGRLADRFGSRLPAFTGLTLIAGALYWLDTINASYSPHDFFVRLSVFGVGLGLTMSPLTNCAISSLPRDKVGVGSGIFNFGKIIGGSIGVVFAETLLVRREIYHAAVLKEYLNSAANAPQYIFALLQALWGKDGMDGAMIAAATHGWDTGHGFLPQQYVAFKALLGAMVARQAAILSFQDVFHTIAFMCFGGGLLALLIKQQRRTAGGSKAVE